MGRGAGCLHSSLFMRCIMRVFPLVAAVMSLALSSCSREVPSVAGADAAGFSAPTPATVAAQAEAAKVLPVEDGVGKKSLRD